MDMDPTVWIISLGIALLIFIGAVISVRRSRQSATGLFPKKGPPIRRNQPPGGNQAA